MQRIIHNPKAKRQELSDLVMRISENGTCCMGDVKGGLLLSEAEAA